MTKKYLVLDLETTGRMTYKRFCNQMDPNHSITMVGYKQQGGEVQALINDENYKQGIRREEVFSGMTKQCEIDFSNVSFMAGQNYKFDLLWFWSDPNLQEWLRNGGQVWDTQTVQYLLDCQQKEDRVTGQFKRNLNTLAVRYGGTLKDDRVGVMFKEGLLANEVPKDILVPYGKYDVENTELVLLGQAQEVRARGIQALVGVYMGHYLLTIDMEFNGIYIDKPLLEKKAKELKKEIDLLTEDILNSICNDWPSDNLPFTLTNAGHVSALLFGGIVKYKDDLPSLDADGKEVRYKSGKKKGEVKTKKTIVEHPLKGLLPAASKYSTKDKKGNWHTDEKVLQSVVDADADPTGLVLKFLTFRKENTVLSRYYYTRKETTRKDPKTKKMVTRGTETGTLPLIHPSTGCLHGMFTTSTDDAGTYTGRMACEKPNVQNLSPKLLDTVCSRWGDKGVILEFDWSQLEVVIQAYLTQCPKMIKDIIAGVDFHCKRLSYYDGDSYESVVELCKTSAEWKAKRSKAKIVTFQKQFGAWPDKLAKESGLTVEQVKMIFEKEDLEYPEIELFYEGMREEIRSRRLVQDSLMSVKVKATGDRIQIPGEQNATGFYTDLTGKTYAFKERGTLTRRGDVFRYFKDTEVKNYPIQGIAATLFMMMGGELYKFGCQHRDKFLFINQVHDSYVLDVRKDHLDFTIKNCTTILESVDKVFERTFGIQLNVPLGFDYCVGSTWATAKAGE